MGFKELNILYEYSDIIMEKLRSGSKTCLKAKLRCQSLHYMVDTILYVFREQFTLIKQREGVGGDKAGL